MSRRKLMVQMEAAAGCATGIMPCASHAKGAYELEGVEAILRSEMAETQAPGAVLAIVRAGQVVHLKGYGTAVRADGSSAPVTEETLFRIGSVTKMFVSATAVALDKEGPFDLNAPVEALVPDLAGDRLKSTVTVRMLLNHHAGLMELLTDNGPSDDGQLSRQVLAYDDTFQILPAGAVFSYSAPGYNLAGLAIERATLLPFADAVAHHLTERLGMERSAFRPEKTRQGDYTEGYGVDEEGTLFVQPYVNNPGDWPDGFFATCGSEMVTFLRTLLGRGVLDGVQVFAPDVIDTLLSPQVQLPAHSKVEEDFGRDPSYGFGWFHDTYRGIRLLHHSGWITGFGAMAILVPEHDLAVFAATSQDNQHLPKTLRAILDAMLPVEPIAKQTWTLSDVPPDPRTELTGRYMNPGWSMFQLREESTEFLRIELDVDGSELGRQPLMLAGTDWLVLMGSDSSPAGELHVIRKSDGTVQALFDQVFAVPVLSE